jgi:AraC-like DNA-binding protein
MDVPDVLTRGVRNLDVVVINPADNARTVNIIECGKCLARAAATLDRTIPHLVRSFTRQFGLSPYAYVTGRRIDAARRLLLQGAAPAYAATAVGFYDQAHLTRYFKRHTATTPAGYARSHPRRAA